MIHIQKAGELARTHHIPVLIHVTELTQPQGHSTSGSHERYKSEDRLKWEKENDCNRKFRDWIIESEIATEIDLDELEKSAQQQAKKAKNDAWDASLKPILKEAQQLVECLIACENQDLIKEVNRLVKDKSINRKKLHLLLVNHFVLCTCATSKTGRLRLWTKRYFEQIQPKFSSNLYNESQTSSL